MYRVYMSIPDGFGLDAAAAAAAAAAARQGLFFTFRGTIEQLVNDKKKKLQTHFSIFFP